ncbi:CDP-diacylglycerol--serine O-phosphatidyltransferase [Ruminiclostridium cellulolyticum]|uniref:CDP-diacylglycerol--serine O-phosphatidyltransferase n=1 Tax=Ruminiclostridium cellulolyticum (strain ATCC 35319 / DSM 5812 / JCM 6584 / H10) TaxID=394503 RepID=B8I3S2_RUMCH|nr:CDP-diacylglycerol--serine O-phosphatidyltransferase [Ruminiclostridium cellulolyticum]ACL74399.1 CDP-diacylglycerol/serine O-phosphatidyltransferase [Ruminiclostridium cellulolyticum H10]
MKNSIKHSLPNLLTFINLSLGIIALLFAIKNDLIQASLLVMVAALTDRFDGKVARMLDSTSELGKELDSLSDLISFGVAPIIIAWKISFFDLTIIGYLLAVMFPIAGAYRLARYNVTTFNNVFSGVPITIAGAFLSIINLYNCFSIEHNNYSKVNTIVTAVIIVLLSYLMISKIQIKKR